MGADFGPICGMALSTGPKTFHRPKNGPISRFDYWEARYRHDSAKWSRLPSCGEALTTTAMRLDLARCRVLKKKQMEHTTLNVTH